MKITFFSAEQVGSGITEARSTIPLPRDCLILIEYKALSIITSIKGHCPQVINSDMSLLITKNLNLKHFKSAISFTAIKDLLKNLVRIDNIQTNGKSLQNLFGNILQSFSKFFMTVIGNIFQTSLHYIQSE